MTSKQTPCIQFKEGKCSRGNNCIFSHDENVIKQSASSSSSNSSASASASNSNGSVITKSSSFADAFKFFSMGSKSNNNLSTTTASTVATAPNPPAPAVTAKSNNNAAAVSASQSSKRPPAPNLKVVENKMENVSISSNYYKSNSNASEKEGKKVRECDIGCGEPGSVVCPKAQHAFCKDCFQNMVKTQLGNGNKELKFVCQMDGCNNSLFELQNVLGNLSGVLLVDVIKLVQDQAIQRGQEQERVRQEEKAAAQAKKTDMEKKIDKIRQQLEDMANRKCPKCQIAYDDFTGCCAVQCSCQAYFCGFCEMSFNESNACHTHVRQCQWNPKPGNFHAERDEWLRANRQCKSIKIGPILNNLDQETRKEAEKDNTIADIMRDHFITFIYESGGAAASGGILGNQNIFGVVGVTCPDGHRLCSFLTANPTFTCDGCKGRQNIGALLYGCRQCNYDLCVSCFQRQRQNNNTAQVRPAPPPLAPPIAQAANQPRCPNDHTLRHFVTPREGYGCNICDIRFPEGTEMYSCRTCDYDVCLDCYEFLKQSSNSRPAIRQPPQQQIVQLRCPGQHHLNVFDTPTTKFYCNVCMSRLPQGYRMHGCRICNYDICINCVDIYYQNPRFGVINRKTLHCPVQHVLRPFVTPNRYYCDNCYKGVEANSQMYGCKECAPTTYDLCEDCYEQQQNQASQTYRNKDGVLVKRGNQGRYYCGRRGLYNCASCDGQCGPNNGCACPACDQFNRYRHIPAYEHAIRMPARAPMFSLGLHNSDGIPVRRGEGGRFFCGRRGLYNCTSCDGQCGPNDGCSCPSCCLLTIEHGIPLHRHQQWMQNSFNPMFQNLFR